MTRGGLSIDQKMVTTFINLKVKSVSDLKDGIDISDLSGESEVLGFSDILEFLSRGLCLDLQRRERSKTQVSTSEKIKGLVKELLDRGVPQSEIDQILKSQK